MASQKMKEELARQSGFEDISFATRSYRPEYASTPDIRGTFRRKCIHSLSEQVIRYQVNIYISDRIFRFPSQRKDGFELLRSNLHCERSLRLHQVRVFFSDLPEDWLTVGMLMFR